MIAQDLGNLGNRKSESSRTSGGSCTLYLGSLGYSGMSSVVDWIENDL